ncbi:prenyltransferase/squalene oxidase repeat-containing protein [Paracoccus luteus]|uniref:prenyltransferase/squalene oxidase repeat-containing protein n=1 Tax=Paracoccus luteus TaxID=2508543 RepID=UPI00106FDA73|nr:prenyltransferase/squalene oxidase repeat-containing protein [Paracoccus luteus]
MPGLRALLENATRRAADLLVARQNADGSWTDWSLPPGPSSEWTTAYVGHCLSRTAAPLRRDLARPMARAAAWLQRHRFPDGGWGYNPAVPSDADSTALAILFLASNGTPAPPGAIAQLRRFQRADGGFSTFLPDGLTGSWGRSHPEITAVALLAAGGRRDPAIDAGIAWLRRARRGDGTWNAFWWATPIGATALGLEVLAAAGCPEPVPDAVLRLDPTDSLGAALLASCLAAQGRSPRLEDLARRLIAAQAPDGSWQGAAALRVTRRDCDTPWDDPAPGPLFADPRRIFTTATVLAALSRVQGLADRT